MKSELVFDDQHLYEEEALVMFKTHLEKFKTVTDKNSRALSYRKLEYLNKKIRRKMMNHTYSHPTGYDEYIKDVEWVIKQFNSNVPYLGTQAKVALEEFLNSKEAEEEEVHQMVLESLIGSTVKPRPRVQRLYSLVDDPNTENRYSETQITEEEKIENEISRDISALQSNGIRNIESQYLNMQQMKIDELERVKGELSIEDPYYKKLEQETDYWTKLRENAASNQQQPVLNSDNKKSRDSCKIL